MTNSQDLFKQAKIPLVGGVNSPVRAFKAVGGDPIFIKSAEGPYITSEDEQKYIDYVLSWGPMLLGHAHPDVIKAVTETAQNGLSFGAPCKQETELAELIQHFMPSCEKIRFVNSGTEATMSALRLARGYTGRDLIIKFEGCYHGHSDALLVSAGSGALTLGEPDSAGVLPELAAKTIVLPYNDPEALIATFKAHPNQIAAVIIEPIAGNMGLVPPKPNYLETLRTQCTANGTLLIFDEVMTGFRVHPGGVQTLYNITPDLTCLGKVIGGGLPCGAYAGKAEIMTQIAPLGPVYQAGTLSGNPIAMAAGIATLKTLKDTDAFKTAETATSTLIEGIKEILKTKNINYQAYAAGTMWGLFFTETPVWNLKDAQTQDATAFKTYHKSMLDQGIYLAPSPYESGFLSSKHTPEIITKTLSAVQRALNP